MQITVVSYARKAELEDDGCFTKSASNQSAFGISKAGLRVAYSKAAYVKMLHKMKKGGASQADIQLYKLNEGKRERAAIDKVIAEHRSWLRKNGLRGSDPFNAAVDIVNSCRYSVEGILHEEHIYLASWSRRHGEMIADYIRGVGKLTKLHLDYEPADDRPEEDSPLSNIYDKDGTVAPPVLRTTPTNHRWLRSRNYTLTVLNFLMDGWQRPIEDTIPVPIYKMHNQQGPRRWRHGIQLAAGEWMDARNLIDYTSSIEYDPDAEPTLPRGALRGIAAVAGGGSRTVLGSAPRDAVAQDASAQEILWSVS